MQPGDRGRRVGAVVEISIPLEPGIVAGRWPAVHCVEPIGVLFAALWCQDAARGARPSPSCLRPASAAVPPARASGSRP